MDTGVLYTATGERYINEVLRSAESLKRVSSEPVTLISNEPVESPYIDTNIVRTFDGDVYGVPYDPYYYKILVIDELPYERTLFLDTDTYIYDDISSLFEWLDEFDMALSLAPHRNTLKGNPKDGKNLEDDVPDSFPDHNNGVMLLKDVPTVTECLRDWREQYFEHIEETQRGQPTLRRVLFNSDVRFATLPPEYNHRYYKPSYAEGTIRIFHGRVLDVEAVAEKLNRTTESRVSILKGGRIEMQVIGQSRTDRAMAAIRNNSFRTLLKKGLNRCSETLRARARP